MKISSAKILLLLLSIIFTAFAFVNTYEVIFNKDVAFANSIRPISAQEQINAIVKQFDLKPEAGRERHNTQYTGLGRLHFPSLESNVYLEEKRLVDGQWYVRPSLAHYIGLNKDNFDVTVDYLIYMQAGWQTLPNPDLLEKGMEVRLFHDGNTATTFKIVEKKVLPLQTTFVAGKSEDRQIVLFIEDPGKKLYYGFSLELKE